MLVLSRLRNESLIIGEGLIKLTIVDIRGDKVRLGIDAPDDIRVDREEVHMARERQKAKEEVVAQ